MLASGLTPLCVKLFVVRNVPDPVRLSGLRTALRLLRTCAVDVRGL